MLTTGEAARLLGVTAQTVINWIESGKLPAVRVGRGRRRIAGTSLRLLIEQNAIPAEANAPELWLRIRQDAPGTESLPPAFMADATGRVLYWSQQAEGLLGWTATERLDHSLSEIPAQVPGLPVDLAELAHEPGDETHLSLLLDFSCRDGSMQSAETTISWIRDAKGRSIGSVFLLEPAEKTSAPAPHEGRRQG